MEIEESARKHALDNAVEYGGECNPSAVIGKVINETGAEPDEVGKIAGRICSEINQLTLEEQKQKLEKYEFEEEEEEHDPLPDLQDAEEGEVVLRFAPNPNGAPHIGHARGMVINGELKQKYNGKLILRFDDTDPVNKRPLEEAYEMQKESFEWLGYEIDEVRYCSKNFDKYIEHAERLIEKGKAYVCKCSQEEGQEYRKEGKACPHRDQDPDKNMGLWEKMVNGGIEEGKATLKIKTDINHKNPAVRDFVAFRIIENPEHPVTGNEYCVWPMLDFQGAIEDHLMGTTHIVRGKELRASTKRQKYIYDYFDWEYPNVRYWGNVQISGFNAPVSTSSLGEMIEKGELDGWDDVRAPTLSALRKRGFQPEAIRNFFVDMGVTENDVEASVETLETANREIVEEDADRYFFVRNPMEIEVNGLPEEVDVELPIHPDFPERGTRNIEIGKERPLQILVEKTDLKDGFVRLKGLCNIEIEGRKAKFVEGDHKDAAEKDADIIHWLPADSPESTVLMPDGEKIEGNTETHNISRDEVVQFERFGFVRCEEKGKLFYYSHE